MCEPASITAAIVAIGSAVSSAAAGATAVIGSALTATGAAAGAGAATAAGAATMSSVAGGAALSSAVAGAGAGASLSSILGAAQLAGMTISAVSALSAGKAQSDAAETNAILAKRAAADAAMRGEEASMAHYREVSQLKGSQIAAASAGGLDVSFGSAAQGIGDTTFLAREDADRIARNSLLEQDTNLIAAMQYKQQARQARTQGYLGAAKSVIGGATRYANRSGFGAG